MVERNGTLGTAGGRPDQLCCVSVNKVFDSARDKDCLEDLRVHLSDFAQEIVDRATSVRCTDVEVINTNISIETVPFNRGFYQVTVRYYFCVTLECCLGGGRVQEVKGLCAFDKKLILYGSEKNVSVFKSDPEESGFCQEESKLRCDSSPTLPSVVVEVADPIALDTKLVERRRPFGNCCICIDAIPDIIRQAFEGTFVDGVGAQNVYVTIGMFSVIRMERKVQLVLPTSNFCLPDKESRPVNTDDPCSIFGKMQFPLSEFYPYAENQLSNNRRNDNGVNPDRGCGCK